MRWCCLEQCQSGSSQGDDARRLIRPRESLGVRGIIAVRDLHTELRAILALDRAMGQILVQSCRADRTKRSRKSVHVGTVRSLHGSKLLGQIMKSERHLGPDVRLGRFWPSFLGWWLEDKNE